MITTLYHGVPTVAQNRVGSHAHLAVSSQTASEWDGHYHFSTHGMAAADVLAKIADLKAYHWKKCQRLNAWQAMKSVQIVVGLDVWQIDHVGANEVGTNVELHVHAVRIDGKDQVEIRSVYPTIDDIPTDAQIVQAVKSRLIAAADVTAQHAAMVQAVTALLP